MALNKYNAEDLASSLFKECNCLYKKTESESSTGFFKQRIWQYFYQDVKTICCQSATVQDSSSLLKVALLPEQKT